MAQARVSRRKDFVRWMTVGGRAVYCRAEDHLMRLAVLWATERDFFRGVAWRRGIVDLGDEGSVGIYEFIGRPGRGY